MSQHIALVDYGSGNVHSAARALQTAADGLGRSIYIDLTDNPENIRAADRIVLPGVGHFGNCMQELQARRGVITAMEQAVLHDAKPFLGICVGMQILADIGIEGGALDGLGWISGKVGPLKRFDGLPLPHMGWNVIDVGANPHPLLAELGDDPHAYFVHSFCIQTNPKNVIATSDYGESFSAAIAKGNIAGLQFHPEKSQAVGQKILQNFLNWTP